MPFIECGPTDVHYLERGSGQPLVLIHGALSSAETWYRHVEAFSSSHRVLTYDSVNHGFSSNSPRGEPEPDRADELEAFLAGVGAERPILAGQSMGGMTILQWAIRHPADARGLIISGMGVPREPMPRPSPLEQSIGDDVVPRRRRVVYAVVLWRRASPGRSVSARAVYRGPIGGPTPPSANDVRQSGSWEAGALAEGVKHIISPMLIVVGSLDYLKPLTDHLHDLVASSRYEVIEGAAHSAHFECFDDYTRIVEDFLATLS